MNIMKVIEKVLVSILVISAVVITFHTTNLIADKLGGTPPKWNERVSDERYRADLNAYKTLRENILFVSRVPLGILMFIVGLIFYKKLSIEVFSVAAISYGAITSTLSGGLFLFRTVGDWAVAILLFLLSLIGLIYITKTKLKKDSMENVS